MGLIGSSIMMLMSFGCSPIEMRHPFWILLLQAWLGCLFSVLMLFSQRVVGVVMVWLTLHRVVSSGVKVLMRFTVLCLLSACIVPLLM